MSIAVSIVVRPSRMLLLMVAAMSGIITLIAGMIMLGLVGGLAFSVRLPLGAVVFFLGLFGFYHTVRKRKALHIDISVAGQIRLAETGLCAEKNRQHSQDRGVVVRLLKDSTLWPHLLLLRLRADDGKVTVVPVLPDSVSPEGFRALSVALRWIAAQGARSKQQELESTERE